MTVGYNRNSTMVIKSSTMGPETPRPHNCVCEQLSSNNPLCMPLCREAHLHAMMRLQRGGLRGCSDEMCNQPKLVLCSSSRTAAATTTTCDIRTS
eukprot:20498-Heterococcus_DN1.PRE.2